ncbi:MAG TPA: hypothetical protein VM533_03395 [Fimbriiglobus sp.]|jgi:hypothetical protein|nr:hypothetical protein [Fimbriiglobus sp.]
MTHIMLSAVLAALPVGDDEKSGAPDVEGKWLIVYVEEGGKRNATWEQQVATVKGDTLSYSKEGDDRSLRLTFGANQTIKVTGAGGKGTGEMSGVYITGQDYLCLSLNPPGDKKVEGKKSSGAFILILRRQR